MSKRTYQDLLTEEDVRCKYMEMVYKVHVKGQHYKRKLRIVLN